jgi:hypothetical protein
MTSAKLLDTEIPRQYLDYVIGGIGGGIQISGLILSDHPVTKMLKDLSNKKGEFVPFECTDSKGVYIGGIAKLEDVQLKEEPAGLRYRIHLHKQ